MNYYEDKSRYWRNCALWTEDEVKFLLSGIWPDEGESAPNSLPLTVIDVPKVETLCSTNESGIQEWLEIHETETVLICPVPSDVTLNLLIEDAVSAGLLTPVPFAGQVRYARHLVNKFRPDDVIRWANKLGCFPDFPFCTESQAVELKTTPVPLSASVPNPRATAVDSASNEAMPVLQAVAVVQPEAIDISMLADPGQLIDAFGRYTNMDKSWFRNWKDFPALRNAIKRKGTNGRGRTTEPLFCPFLVMQGLMKKPRKGSKRQAFLNDETPWRMLKQHFPSVYDMHQGLSPLDD